MQISAALLFNAIKENPSQAKQMLQSALEEKLNATNNDKLANQTILKSANKLLDTLFSKVTNGSISKNEAVKTIQNSALFKQEVSSMGDLKQLLQLVQKEPKLSRFIAPLKDFLQHVSTSNGHNLSTQIKNSGIGLEAKLTKNSMSQTSLLETKAILTNIFKELQTLPQNRNNNTNQSIKNIKNLLSQKAFLKEDLTNIHKQVTNLLKDTSPLKNVSSLKNISSLPTSKNVQDLLIHLDKIQLASNNLTKQDLKNITLRISKSIASLSAKSNLAPSQTQELQTIIKDMVTILKSIENKPLSTQEKHSLVNLLANNSSQIQSNPQNRINLNTQEQLKLLTLKLKQSIEIVDKQSLQTHQGQKNIKGFLDSLQNEISRLPNTKNTQSSSLQNIEKDMKHTLLKLSDTTSSAVSQNQQEIHSLANKSLTQIQMHQLISYANSSIHTYVPYSWENLKEGNISFKQGKEDSFYCKIDLELKMYGKVDMMLQLTEDRYINISISTEKESLKEKIAQNIPILKNALSKIGLSPLNIHLKPLEKSSYSSADWSDFSLSLRV